ncbi:hypothetical protein [uncultured Desulfobacter sp.]|uniref:hypothetical protein n=1 Tax=uncultured Desulfobacter sp. TaxID=240139 RepID=UPI002AABCBF2|nr:hypothetical protein [uncultured Desulfobacter sp.]
MDKKNFLKKITAIAAVLFIIGCAGSPKPTPPEKVIGKWQSLNINADGSKADWPEFSPQYKNTDTGTKMWVSNNAEQICLLVQVKNPGTARQLSQGGLILSIKTTEKDAKPFLIRLKGHTPLRLRSQSDSGPDQEGAKNPGTPDPSATAQDNPPAPMPDVRLPDAVTVTYPFSSGPVIMSMNEARATGIALGLADEGHHTLVFEAAISLDAIFFDVPRIADTVMNITLSSQGSSFGMKREASPGENNTDRPKGGPPGGGKPGGEPPDQGASGAKSHDMKQTDSSERPFRAAVEITLAGPSK